jgi:hypothetical protein
MAASGQQRMYAVTADVVESSKIPSLVSNDEDALIDYFANVVIAGILKIRDVALIGPRPVKDFRLLALEDVGVEVPV